MLNHDKKDRYDHRFFDMRIPLIYFSTLYSRIYRNFPLLADIIIQLLLYWKKNFNKSKVENYEIGLV